MAKATKKVAKKAAKKVAGKAPAKAPIAETTYKLKAGDKAPTLKFPKTSKSKVVLYFYPKDNTPGCTLEGHDFRRLYKDFERADCEIFGVSRDSMKSHEKFREKCGFPFELIADEDGKLCTAYDVIQMKSLYGRKFEGIERSTFVIDKAGRVAREWRKVKVSGHADEVLEFVKSLGSKE